MGNLGVDVKSMKSEVEKLKDFQKQVEQELAKMKLQKDTEACYIGFSFLVYMYIFTGFIFSLKSVVLFLS